MEKRWKAITAALVFIMSVSTFVLKLPEGIVSFWGALDDPTAAAVVGLLDTLLMCGLIIGSSCLIATPINAGISRVMDRRRRARESEEEARRLDEEAQQKREEAIREKERVRRALYAVVSTDDDAELIYELLQGPKRLAEMRARGLETIGILERDTGIVRDMYGDWAVYRLRDIVRECLEEATGLRPSPDQPSSKA